jgi:hypothetical protein
MVMVVVVAVVVVGLVAGLGRSWTSCQWPLEWWCLDKRARTLDAAIANANEVEKWRGMDEVACE